jgi:glycosyltransferase involved in cell wall biosynthesis
MTGTFWSVMIPTFNCTETLRRTVESVLSAMPGSEARQIEIVDDCSDRDDPSEVASEYRQYGVTFYRQPRNVGATNNFNACIARARGEWIHILHGDDYVDRGFYSLLGRDIVSYPNARVAFTSFAVVDEGSNPLSTAIHLPASRGLIDSTWRDVIAVHNRIMAPAIVVQRSAYAEVGGFDSRLNHTADWDMWKRLIWRYATLFEPEVLAYYTAHSKSDSSRLMRSGSNLLDSRRAISIGKRYFPIARQVELSRRARISHANMGLFTAERFLASGDYRAALAQLSASMILSPSLALRQTIPKILARHFIRRRKAISELIS